MNVKISTVSKLPIYEQIKNQIREQILSGELPAETQLPSIRALARELKVGVITTKRAYDDLCEEGILVSRAGKGVFVVMLDYEYLKKIQIGLVKDQLIDVKEYADSMNIGKDEVYKILDIIYGKEK